MTAFIAILYACAIIGVTIYLLGLASRFVKAHERIADALQRGAHMPRREG